MNRKETSRSIVSGLLSLFVSRRAWNISLRTAHIGVTGILLGGHVFGADRDQLAVWLYLTVLTGVILALIEAYPNPWWFCEGRGVSVLIKLALLGMVPWFWRDRVLLLAAVVVIASVGSHMPGRFRYYSFIHRRVMEHSKGP